MPEDSGGSRSDYRWRVGSGRRLECGDGILSQIGTFQKFFTQAELRDYLETTLGTEALPADPGVCLPRRNALAAVSDESRSSPIGRTAATDFPTVL